jgi:hypothetical protein
MVVQDRSEEPVGQAAEPYEPPSLTRFGTIEEWTLGVLGGISISIVV